MSKRLDRPIKGDQKEASRSPSKLIVRGVHREVTTPTRTAGGEQGMSCVQRLRNVGFYSTVSRRQGGDLVKT